MPHLTLLGGAMLEDESGPVTGPAARRHPLALMALLATAPSGTRSRSKLAGLLWPETPEKRARNRLNTCVYRVRSTLGDAALASVGDDLRLERDEVGCDVVLFEEALEAGEHRRAVDLYGGPFLDGFRLKGSPAFEKWTDRERDRLARAYRDALEALAADAEEDGDPAAAARWWRKRAREDPYDSRVVRRLMETLAAAGSRAEALRAARVHGRLLEDELGTGPDAGVRELAARLEAGDAVTGPGDGPEGGDEVDPGEASHGPASDDPEADSGPSATTERPAAGAADGDGGGGRLRVRRALATAVLLLLAAGGVWYGAGRVGAPTSAPASGDAPTVAVLPFDALGEGGAGVFAEGMHGDLLTRLAHVSGLDVIAATSVERYRDSDLPLPVIADSLGAAWVVEGGVQQAGEHVQVNAQLVDPRSETHAWAESYRRDLTARDLFDLQSEIARRIARSLEARLTSAERDRVERRPTDDLGAYRSYVRGRDRLEERTDEATRRAAELFGRAVRSDSAFALAWAGLADVALLRAEYGHGPLADSLEVDPERAARRALALDSTLAEAHVSLGYVHLNRSEGPAAVRRFRRAVELKPGSAVAHFRLGEALATVGRLGRTIPHVERAVELDPLAPVPRIPLGGFYYLDGRLEAALREIRQGQDLAPDLSLGYLLEGQSLSATGRHEEALRAFERGRELASPGSVFARAVRAWPAVTHARAGDTAPARRLLSSFATTPEGLFDRAAVHAALGEEEAALDALAGAEISGHYLRVFLFRYAPVFDPLRDEPAYRDVLRRVDRALGLEPAGARPTKPAAYPPPFGPPRGVTVPVSSSRTG